MVGLGERNISYYLLVITLVQNKDIIGTHIHNTPICFKYWILDTFFF